MSIIYDLGYGRNKDYVIGEDEFDKNFSEKYQSVMDLGNGYLSLRDYFEEDSEIKDGESFIKHNDLSVLIPDMMSMTIFIDDEEFNLETFEIIDYQRTLNMRSGVSERTIKIRRDKKEYKILFEKFVSMNDPNLCGQRFVISSKKENSTVKIIAGINGGKRKEFEKVELKSIEDKYLQFYFENGKNEFVVHSKIITDAKTTQKIVSENNNIAFEIERKIDKGKTFVFEKITTIRASFDERVYDEEVVEEDEKSKEKEKELDFLTYSLDKIKNIKDDVDDLMQQSETAWNQKIWSNFDIKIDSTGDIDQFACRFSIYHDNKSVLDHLDNFQKVLASKEADKLEYEDFKKIAKEIIKDGTNSEGLLWKIVLTQFAGITLKKGLLNMSPKLPDDWSSLEFNLPHEDIILKFEITNNVMKITHKEDEEYEAVIFGRKRSITKNTIIPYLR